MAHIQRRTYRSRRTGKTITSYQARYTGPDGKERTRRFAKKAEAERWTDINDADIARRRWVDPEAGQVRLRDYAADCLAGRDLRDTTRSKYDYLLHHHLLPMFGDKPIANITLAMVRAWYAPLKKKYPTTAAGAYRLLASLFNTAVEDEVLPTTPCRIKRAGSERSAERPTASIPELDAAIASCPIKWQLAPLLATWCQLRRGEVLGLQRQDIDLVAGACTVQRTWSLQHDGTCVLGPPKTEAGVRTLMIPPNVLPALEAHLDHVGEEPATWLFEGEDGRPAHPRTLDRVWAKARAACGRPDLRFHDLRHTGLTWTAMQGATTKELMRRGGHASPAAALRYQHATTDRDRVLANALGHMAQTTNVVALRRTKDGRSSPKGAVEEAG